MSTCGHAGLYEWVHVCTRAWGGQVDIGHPPQPHSTLFIEAKSLTEHGVLELAS